MRIDIKKATIRIDNHADGHYSMHFSTPFNCFIALDLNKAKVTYKIDSEETYQYWKANDVIIKKILLKTAHETNRQLFTRADIEGNFQMEINGVVAIITQMHLSCTTSQLEMETPWEKRERETRERLQTLFSKNSNS